MIVFEMGIITLISNKNVICFFFWLARVILPFGA